MPHDADATGNEWPAPGTKPPEWFIKAGGIPVQTFTAHGTAAAQHLCINCPVCTERHHPTWLNTFCIQLFCLQNNLLHIMYYWYKYCLTNYEDCLAREIHW
jgi:hypothetical protein